jgi:hypothetical protein
MNTRSPFAPLVDDLAARLAAAGLSPEDEVRALAELLAAVGYRMAAPGSRTDRAAVEGRLLEGDDLASTLILQAYILREWVAETEPSQQQRPAA